MKKVMMSLGLIACLGFLASCGSGCCGSDGACCSGASAATECSGGSCSAK